MKKLIISLITILILSSCEMFKKSVISEVEEIELEDFESGSVDITELSEEVVTTTDFRIVHITKSKFGTYPAVFFDLVSEQLVEVEAGSFEQQSGSFEKALFIEPRNEVIKVFDAKSEDTKNIVLPISFNYVTQEYIASHSFMTTNELGASQLKKGVVFGTKFFDGSIYKFEILVFNKDKQEITLKYQKLK